MTVKFQLESLDHKGNTEVEICSANCVTGSMKVVGCIIIAKKMEVFSKIPLTCGGPEHFVGILIGMDHLN